MFRASCYAPTVTSPGSATISRTWTTTSPAGSAGPPTDGSAHSVGAGDPGPDPGVAHPERTPEGTVADRAQRPGFEPTAVVGARVPGFGGNADVAIARALVPAG